MLNLSRVALATMIGIVIVLAAIAISTNAITARLDRIADTFERQAQREALDQWIAESKTRISEFAKTVEQLRGELQKESLAHDKLEKKLAQVALYKPNIINLELYLILEPPGEYQVMVNVANPPITSGIGEVLDQKHAIQIGESPDSFISVADRRITERRPLQYLVTQGELENGLVSIDYSATKKGDGEGEKVGAMRITFKALLEEGRTELGLTNGATLIVFANRGAGTIPTF